MPWGTWTASFCPAPLESWTYTIPPLRRETLPSTPSSPRSACCAPAVASCSRALPTASRWVSSARPTCTRCLGMRWTTQSTPLSACTTTHASASRWWCAVTPTSCPSTWRTTATPHSATPETDGLGLGAMRVIVESYGGTLSTSTKEDVSHLNVLLSVPEGRP